MEKINHNFKKKFGQNFLTDNNIIVNTVSSVLLQEDDLVIEIGPGSGMLTKEILKKCRVLAYEIDTDLIDTLSNIPNNEKLTIIWDDFLKRDVVKDIEKFRYNKLYIIANLPYYITTPIITKVIESDLDVSKMVIMVQKEVGDRFSSKPGNKEYGSITVFLNYYFNIKKLFDVFTGVSFNFKFNTPFPDVLLNESAFEFAQSTSIVASPVPFIDVILYFE